MTYQHFGISNASVVDSIVVKWTTGNVQKLANVQPNQYITIDECLLGIISYNNEIPQQYALSQNYPNPFNPTTRIKFALPESGNVILKLYDNLGKEISTLVNENLNAGQYEYEFDGSNLGSGVYYYKIFSDNFVETKKMVLVK
jgi:hypothetical protein